MKPTPDPDDEPLTEGLQPLTTLRPLSDRDRDAFLAALDNPPPPNEALKRLMSGEKSPK